MYVRTLYADGAAVAGPSWSQVEQAIRKLTAPQQSVCLSAHPQGAMTIFRVHSPCYLVVGPHDTYLKDPERNTPTDRVPLETALKAARTFCETGELDTALAWFDPEAREAA